MGCSLLSVVSSVAAAGLMGGGGLIPGLSGFDLGGITGGFGDVLSGFDLGSLGELGINTDLLDNLGGFELGSMDDVLGGMDDLIGNISTEAFDVCGDLVGDVLGELPDGLTGLIDTDIFSDFALEGLDFASPNLFESLSGQASSFLQNGTSGLTEIINGAKSFAEQSASALASIQNAANFQIGGQTFNAMSIFDQVTGGALTKVFEPVNSITNLVSGAATGASNLLASVQQNITGLQNQYTQFTSDVSQWGSMFDVSNLDKAFDPGTFTQNLVNQNVPGLSQALSEAGITPSLVSNADPAAILNVLSNIPKNITDAVTTAVGFTKPLASLAEALVPAAVLSAGAIALVKDFRGVSDKLSVVGPTNVQNIGQLGQELNKIKFPASSVLLGIERSNTQLADTLNYKPEQRTKVTGSGTGVFGNPTMDDMMGSFTGTYYTPRLIGMLSAQKRLLDTTEGQTLKAAIQLAVSNARANLNTDAADAARIRSALQALLARTDSQTAEDFALLERFQQDLLDKLVVEKRNLKAAKLDTTEAQGSISSIMGFVSSLELAYDDAFKIGYADWINGASGQDQYGDAIRMAMIEGANRNLLQGIGVDSRTTSVFDYADQYAAEQAALLAKCCPPYSAVGGYPDAGALLSTYCENFNLYGIYADGNGMSYYRVIENNSLSCGFTTTTTSTTSTSTSTTSTSTTSTSTTSTSTTSTSTTTSTTTAAPTTTTTTTTTEPGTTTTTTLAGTTTTTTEAPTTTTTTTSGPTTTTTLGPGETTTTTTEPPTTTSTSTTSTSTSTTSTSTTSTTTGGPTTTTTLGPAETTTTSTTSTSTSSSTTTTSTTEPPTTTTSTSSTTTTTTTAAPLTIDTLNFESSPIGGGDTFNAKITWTTTGADQCALEIFENSSLYDSYTGLSADNPTTGVTIPSLSGMNSYEAKLTAIRNSDNAEVTSSVYF